MTEGLGPAAAILESTPYSAAMKRPINLRYNSHRVIDHIRIVLVTVALATTLVGCFPVYVVYYRPHASTGEIARTPGRANTPDIWAVQSPYGPLYVSARLRDARTLQRIDGYWATLFQAKSEDKRLFLYFRLNKLDAHTASSAWTKHTVKTRCGVQSPLAVVSVAPTAPAMEPPYVNVLTETHTDITLDNVRSVILGFEGCAEKIDSFTFQPEPIRVDGETLTLPPIVFKASSRVGLASINGT